MYLKKDLDNSRSEKASILPPVFYPSAFLIGLLVIVTLVAGERASAFFAATQAFITTEFGWVYMTSVVGFLLFGLYIAIGKTGEIKLGPNQAEPEYSFTSWFAMLFSAGIGIGLLFYGVAEPLTHYMMPPNATPETIAAAKKAMQITYFHWGINAWAIYAIVGLILAYFSFRHNLPLTIRSALYPLIGDRIYGPAGHVVDTIAVVGTLFGVATSLGFGVSQVNAGLNYLFDIPYSTTTQIVLIAVITAFATASVVSGLDAGIKKLSEINMVLATLLLLFVIAAGPTLLILNSFVENLGLYISTLVERSFYMNAYREDQSWLAGWTLFYWGWWISWSPFVGIFIARISRGRTIREFMLGVLLVPSLFTFIWMTAFGNSAISFEMNGVMPSIADAIENNLPLGIFAFLEHLPFSGIVSFCTILLIMTFFVTSSDSGSLVIDTITSGGHMNPPVWQRVFWAVTEGVVAAVLMIGGGLVALQTATITIALPFTFVIIIACMGLMKGLKIEAAKMQGAAVAPDVKIIGAETSWKQRLSALMTYPSKRKVEAYVAETVMLALHKVGAEIMKNDCAAEALIDEENHEIRILHGGETDFLYTVRVRSRLRPDFAYINKKDEDDKRRFYQAEVDLLEGSQHYCVYGYSEEQLIHDILSQYNKHIHFLNIARS
ncbi:BCCT family transporter [Kordiimonas pumila]|uniref:BCCT family transporter n=1 Tax=Kordiimonas pumila TaxID=2161677 RepID=A0ABV7D7V0_9PROT|nr:BCCT family transporter [Kordiimonas pumila]